MGWFFPISKLVGLLVLPSHLLLWLVLATSLSLLLGRRRAAGVLAVCAAALFLLIGAFPLGLVMARPLEAQVPRPALPAHVDGVVTLGGGLNTEVLVLRGAPGAAPSLDRLVSTYELARLHPEARIVFSGGWGRFSDAIAARDDFRRMGLDPGRLVLEGRSRNTAENLAFSQALVRPRPGEVWVLATSGLQLPRAMRVARRLGWRMIPWATDYRTAERQPLATRWFRIGENLQLADEAAHEWIGLGAYALTGLGRAS